MSEIAQEIKTKRPTVSTGPRRPTIEEQRKKDHEVKRGIFRYLEVPGGVLRFPFKKYKEDKVHTYELFDNQIYELPLMVANHINDNLWYPEYSHTPGDPTMRTGQNDYAGGNVMRVTKKIHRASFSPLDFTSENNFGISNILEVQNTGF